MSSRRRSPLRVHRTAAVFLWIAGRAVAPGSPVPYGLAVGAVGVAYLGDSTPGQRVALASSPAPGARPLTRENGPSCPLPVGQQVKAVRAFAEMLPVLRHPRCLNCHGGMEVLSDRHPGAGGLDDALNPRTVPMTPDFREAFELQCVDCHDGLKGWTVPPPALFFVDKNDEKLCMQMKGFGNNTGDLFVSHIHDDHGGIQFIAAGFVGDRALGEQGLKDERLTAEPPPGTQAELTKKAKQWVDIMGAHAGWVGDPPCGCVMPKIKLEIDHTMMFEVPKGLPSKEESQVKFEVKLEPAGDPRLNMFAGEHRLNREIKMTLPPTCKGKASRQERWMVYALIDSMTGSIKVRHTAFDDEPTGEIVCNQGRGTARMGIFPGHVSLVAWEAVIPADSGSSKTLRAEDVGRKEALTITVLEVPGGE